MIMALIQAGVGLAGAAQKGVAAFKQNKMAKEYGKTKRPDFQIAPSLIKATDMARANLNPAINPQELLEVDKDAANTLAIAKKIGGVSTSDVLAGVIGAQANKYAAKRNLFASNQNRKDAAMSNYMSILGNMAGQENQAFEWNKAQPYLNAQEAAQALNQTSAKNAGNMLGDLSAGIGGAVNTYATSANQAKQNDLMKQMLIAMFGGKTGGMLPKVAESGANPNLQIGKKMSPLVNIVLKNLDKIPNMNANVPPAQQVAEKPVAPIIRTTSTGQVLANGKPMTNYDFSGKTTEELQNRLKELEGQKYGFGGKSTQQLKDRLAKLEKDQVYQMLISNPQFLQAIIGE